jgi:hypothetical protein
MEKKSTFSHFVVLAVAVLAGGSSMYGQEGSLISRDAIKEAMATKDMAMGKIPAPPKGPLHDPTVVQRCKGPIKKVVDAAYEGVKITSFNRSNTTGGGESGRFDRTPVLSTTVNLTEDCSCLDAHLSAMVGSKQTYGGFLSIASITMFQVTLTPASGGPPLHMVGHFETPYGSYGPAVALEAERDVDMLGANFFQRVGDMPGDVPPGVYRVDVWWSGGPVGGGGAIGADFVLKLYQR